VNLAQKFDAITVAQLRAAGSVKWSSFPDAIGAFVAEMDFGTAPVVSEAINAAIANNQFGYLPEHLTQKLQEAFVAFAKRRYGWSALRPNQVRPVPDVLGACEAVMRFIADPEAAVVLPTPAYMPFRPLLESLGRRVIDVPMVFSGNRWTNDLLSLESALSAGPAWLFLVNPHNPTGRVFERSELENIAEIVEGTGSRVFADEIHAPLVYPPKQHIPYAAISPTTAAHTVTAHSASKAWNLPGLKAAQLILTSDDDLKTWQQRGGWTEHLTSTLGVIAQTAAYQHGEAWLAEVIDYLRQNRALLTEFIADKLPAVRFSAPEGTYLAWLDFNNYALLDEHGNNRPAAWLRDHAGVALTEGHDCGPAGDGFARLNLATPRPILEQALNQIAAALNTPVVAPNQIAT